MGKLRNGILGSITGKVSGVVGSTWKGINTLRAYAIPSNPKSAAQVTQRGLFGFVVNICSMLLIDVVQPYWDPFASKISGFNAMVKHNLLRVTSSSDYSNIQVANGNLESAAITAFTYDTSDGDCSITYDDTPMGNGADDDNVCVVIVDAENNVVFVDDGTYTRVDTPATPNIGAGRTATSLHAYLFCYRGSGSSLLVSDSTYHVGVAA
jgi:hypothetical protein